MVSRRSLPYWPRWPLEQRRCTSRLYVSPAQKTERENDKKLDEILGGGAHCHPPHSSPSLRELVLNVTRMQLHIHCTHERLSRTALHLLQIAPLSILIHAENIKRNDALQLSRQVRVKGPAKVVVVLLAQRSGGFNCTIRDLLVVLEGLECRLRKVLRILAAEELRIMGLMVGVLWTGDKGKNGGYGQADG